MVPSRAFIGEGQRLDGEVDFFQHQVLSGVQCSAYCSIPIFK